MTATTPDTTLDTTALPDIEVQCMVGREGSLLKRVRDDTQPCTETAEYTATTHMCIRPDGTIDPDGHDTEAWCSKHTREAVIEATSMAAVIMLTPCPKHGSACCTCGRPIAQLSDLIWDIKPLR